MHKPSPEEWFELDDDAENIFYVFTEKSVVIDVKLPTRTNYISKSFE